MIELLNAQEALQTELRITDNAKLEAPQAYILALGPGVDQKIWGFSPGDRVVFSGMMTPLPKLEGGTRQRGIIDAFSVRAVLAEGSSLVI